MKWLLAVLPAALALVAFVFFSSGCSTPTGGDEVKVLEHAANRFVPVSALSTRVYPEDPSAIEATFAYGLWCLPQRGVCARGEDRTVYYPDGSEMTLFVIVGKPELPTIYSVIGPGRVRLHDGVEHIDFFGLPPLMFIPDEPVRDSWRRLGTPSDTIDRMVTAFHNDNEYQIQALITNFR